MSVFPFVLFLAPALSQMTKNALISPGSNADGIQVKTGSSTSVTSDGEWNIDVQSQSGMDLSLSLGTIIHAEL